MPDRARNPFSRSQAGFTLAAALTLGATAVVAQSVLLRELSLLWFGSELSWGMTLSGWLAGVAVGAAGAGWLSRRMPARVLMPLLAVALAATLPAGLWLLRSARSLLGTGAGEFVATGQMLALTAATAGSAGLWVGAMFPAGAALAGGVFGPGRRGIGVFFLTEALGTLIGGAAFTFWWVERVDPFTLSAATSGALLLAVAGAVVCRRRGQPRRAINLAAGLVAAVAGGVLIAAAGRGLGRVAERAGQEVRWRGLFHAPERKTVLPHVAGTESRFGRIDLGELHGQWTLYLNCRPAGTFPDRESTAPFVHLSASQCPRLGRVLVIGSATGEPAAELARYGGASVESIELDEKVHDCLAAHVRPAPRRPTRFADGRRFVKTAPHRYDLILLAVGDPTSIAAGRFYTREFFAEARRRLTDEGVLAFALAGPAGKISPDLRDYLASVRHALAGAFAETLWTWSDPTWVFAAGRAGVLTADPAALARRYRAHGGPADFDPDYFLGYRRDRLQPAKIARLAAALDAAPAARVNTDDRPVAMFLNLRRQEQTLRSLEAGPAGPKRTALLALFGRVRLWHALAAVGAVGVVGCGAALLGRRRGAPGAVGRAPLLASLATTGVATIGLEIVLLTAFQALYGYVYSHVGLIVALYMAGVAAGAWTQSRPGGASPARAWRRLVLLDLALCAACALTPALRPALAAGAAGAAAEWIILAAVAAVGVAGGMALPLAAGLYARAADRTGAVAGAVDAADCLGGAAGALAVGLVLLPLLGAWLLGAVLAALKLTAVAALLIARPGATNGRPLARGG